MEHRMNVTKKRGRRKKRLTIKRTNRNRRKKIYWGAVR
jgi:hypothetical protein